MHNMYPSRKHNWKDNLSVDLRSIALISAYCKSFDLGGGLVSVNVLSQWQLCMSRL